MEKIKCRTVEEAYEAIKLLNTNVFSFDTETTDVIYTKLKITGISFCDGTLALYFYIDDKNRDEMIEVITDFFESLDNQATIIAHNIVFDMKVLWKYGINVNRCKWFDTMIAHHLLDENSMHGLKHLTRTILNREVVEFNEVGADHYTESFGDYGLADSINTWDLAQLFKGQLVREGLTYLFNKIEMPFQRCLLQMTVTGVEVNQELLHDYSEILKKELIDLESQLYDTIDEKYAMQMDVFGNIVNVAGNRNFNSGHQLADIMFNKLGLKIIERTPTDQPKTGKVTIEKYKNTHPFVSTLYKYKIASKLYSGFISSDGQIASNLESDGKVRPYFNDVGTKTGRLSCVRPNLQQLSKPKDYAPVEVRKLFVAPKGYKMITGDFSGQETAIMAHQSRDPALVDSLNKGMDMHMVVANTFYKLGIPEEKLFKTHPEFSSIKSKYKKERTQAKTITFGLAYGKGAYGFAKDFEITEGEAQVLVDSYFAGMSKLKESIDKAHKELTDKGYVKSMAGRYRHFTKLEDGTYPGGAYRQSFNFLIQGFAGDMMRASMINVYALGNKHPEWDLKLIMTIHDELNCTVKEEYAEMAGKAVKEAMEKSVKLCVPTPADIDITTDYSQAK